MHVTSSIIIEVEKVKNKTQPCALRGLAKKQPAGKLAVRLI